MIEIDVYVISLASRPDRREATLAELGRSGFTPDLVHIVDAHATPSNGAIGCAMTHAMALSRFLFESEGDWCLVVEDDFQCQDPVRLQRELPALLLGSDEWDVLMLASNTTVPVRPTRFAGVFRVLNAQTTSAYLVHRRYAPTLIKVFYESAHHMTELMLNLNFGLQKHFFAIDQAWKSLQIESRFLAFLPQLSIQRESYSDIENTVLSYGV
jgi:GR25 family glycosyltransferase involved in LPS biosynthesis